MTNFLKVIRKTLPVPTQLPLPTTPEQVLSRVWIPLPQVTEQSDHSDQSSHFPPQAPGSHNSV